MPKFEVGDKIRIIGKSVGSNWSSYPGYDRGFIKEIRNDGKMCRYKYNLYYDITDRENGPGGWHFLECDIMLVDGVKMFDDRDFTI